MSKIKLLLALFFASLCPVQTLLARTAPTLPTAQTLESGKTYYNDPKLHLTFVLDTETKEAMLGNGTSEKHNALAYPPLGESWWTDGQKNLWENIIVPDSITYNGEVYTVTSVGSYAFYKCTDIRSVVLPETISSIGDCAFCWSVNLETINIPSKVTKIGYNTFQLCRKIKSIQLPDGITSIESGAFSDCSGLIEITIPGNCLSIGSEAFRWCKSLEKVVIEDGSSTLSCGYTYGLGLDYDGAIDKPKYRGLFADCPLNKVYIGRDISSPRVGRNLYPPFYSISNYGVNSSGFQGMTGKNFSSVSFGDSVEIIPDSLFCYSTIDNEIVLPKNLKAIGKDAFANGALYQSKLTIPKTLNSIGDNAFYKNENLRFMYFEGNTPPVIPDATFGHPFWGCNISFVVPEGAGQTYRSAKNWENYEIIDPGDKLITINVKKSGSLYDRLLAQDTQADEVFKLKLKGTLNDDDWSIVKQMSHLHELDLSDLTIDSLPNNLFKSIVRLTSILLPNTIKTIGDSEFSSCKYLTGVLKIPSQCKKIGERAFWQTALEGIDYTGSIEIGPYAFGFCKFLDTLRITGERTVVGASAFWGSGVKNVAVGSGVSIGQECFFYCQKLKEILFEDSVEYIGFEAFGSCYNLKKITLEGYIKNVGNDIFSYCKNFTEVHIKDVSSWCQTENKSVFLTGGASLFVNGEKPTEIDIPEGVNTIEAYSFYGCDLLKKVTFPKSLKQICSNAFSGCTRLTDIQLPDSLTKIGANAFDECSSLTSVDFPLSLSFIGEYAFNDCSGLVKFVAHWDTPFAIENTVFKGVSSDCYLYVPIGTATLYSKNGWNVPNMKAVGILSISANHGGVVCYEEESLRNTSMDIFFSPYKSFYITIIPDKGYSIRKVIFNEKDITSQLEDGKLFIEEPEENLNLTCTFSDDKIPMGDANGDGIVNVADAICAINVILKNMPNSFYDYASDMNDDGVINITDAVLIIKKIIEK